jgi:hypothetical protein
MMSGSAPSEKIEETTPNEENMEEVVVISANNAFDGHKLKNFYLTNAFQ